METVYLETTIVSYLVAYPSQDLIANAHQQITREWWDTAQKRFTLFISKAVLEEISAGDPLAAARRQKAVFGLPILELKEDVRELVRNYEKNLGFPKRARSGLIHIAFAVAYEMDYLLNWNCYHIGN